MINLNGNEFKGTAIFNGGNAGLTTGVTISVVKRQVDEPENYPDYKLIVKDESGAELSQGFYYYKPNPDYSDDKNATRETQEISRVVHLARAVMGPDYEFPAANTAQEAFDVLFKLIKENAGTKLFNVFTTYGTTRRPSKYLGLRYFDFIESVEGPSRLRVKAADNMERITPDSDTAPVNSEEDTMGGSPASPATSNVEEW